jgi:hypothetical protein
MGLKARAQSVLAAIIIAEPDSVASVVANVKTADGVKDTTTKESELSDAGEVGLTSGTIRCNADTIGASSLAKGQTFTVAGVDMFLHDFKIDSQGAIVTMEYSNQRAVT